MSNAGVWDYAELKDLIRGEQLPLILVDLDVLDANVGRLARLAGSRDTSVRTASKSVRVPELLRRIIAVGRPHLRGVMCFAAAEARLLAAEGFDDLLIAYPVVQRADLETTWELTRQGRTITLMVDELPHLEILTNFRRAQSGSEDSRPLRVCIDADMSWRPLGLHVGAQRSPIRDLPAFERLIDAVLERPELQLVGVMAYEAQIAGIGERNPFTPLRNPVTRFMKRRSTVDVADKRKAIADLLTARSLRLEFFNGGGTGSIRTTTEEEWVTEVTAGSGFLQSHLFDYYADTENQPAFCFALPITRCPQSDRVTCQSGGFVASGPPTVTRRRSRSCHQIFGRTATKVLGKYRPP